MEVKLTIGYEQLIAIISQLPADEVSKLKLEIEKLLPEDELVTEDDWESLIANGPVMSDEQYRTFEENRENFERWRKN